jgi:NADH dehydrogenase
LGCRLCVHQRHPQFLEFDYLLFDYLESDWTLELFFPKDINLLNPRYTRVLKQIHLEPGSVLFRKGDPAFSLYVVKSGCVEIGDESGLVQSVGPGEYFGERALLLDRVWQFDGRASEPTVLVSIPADTFHQIVQGTGSLGRLFQKSAAKYQSREIIQTLIDLMAEDKNAAGLLTEIPRSS